MIKRVFPLLRIDDLRTFPVQIFFWIKASPVVFTMVVILLVTATPPVRAIFPAAVYAATLAVLITFVMETFCSLPAKFRKGLVITILVAVGFQAAVWQARSPYSPQPDWGWLDDYAYATEPLIIAQAWSEGVFPALSMKGDLPRLGTLHTAWHRLLAGWSFIAGTEPWQLLMIQGLFIAVLPIVTFAAARDLAFFADISRPHKAALFSAAAAAVYPSLPYYGSFLLKDLATGVFGVLGLAAALGCLRRRSGAWVVLAACMFWLLPLRAYTGLAVIFGLALLAARRLTLAQLSASVCLGLLALFLLSFSPRGAAIAKQLHDSLLGLMPQNLVATTDFVLYLLAGTIRIFLAPYPWVVAEGDFPNYEVYFGQWYLFLLMYPLGLAFVTHIVRKNLILPSLPWLLIGAALFVPIVGFGGNITRQRLFADLWLICTVGPGVLAPGKKLSYFVLVVTFVSMIAAAQLTKLFLAS